MPHVSLYRKYRPATFDEVMGQEHVTRTLVNAIESGMISHAYLFAGSRGTGKTSTAKLLAMALNCVDGPTAHPCGKCDSCVSISAGSSLDVIEMDAASNRGIDDIRDIRDKVAFATVEGKYKVYILDEAHMLTKEASNAFLKILEEPPAHVIFVLCTTEAHKVIPTIQSRCQRFEFRRPDAAMVLEVLTRIAAAEGIDIDDESLATIARSSAGAFRDAIGSLDQLSTYCEKKILLADVLSMLGTVESELLFEAVDIVASSDARGAILFINRLADRGRDFGQFAQELVAHLRNIFLMQQLDEYPPGIINVTGDDLVRLKGQARILAADKGLRFIELLTRALSDMKRGSDPRLQLELAFIIMTAPQVDMSTKSMLDRIERLEAGLPVGGKRRAAPAAAAPVEQAVKADKTATEASAPDAEPAEAATPLDEHPAASIELSLDKITRAWSVILNQVKKKKIPLYSLLHESRPVELTDRLLVIGFPPGAEFHKTQAEKPQYTAIINEVLQELTGADLKIKCVVAEGVQPQAREQKGPSADEVIAMIKDELGAEEI
ncbi:MAG: DNA polymerase III subunit gamma/tau [Thermoleophilia bacterium]